MNKIDELIKWYDHSKTETLIDRQWYISRPENNKKYMTSFWYRFKEALNVLNGKAETLYYYKQ